MDNKKGKTELKAMCDRHLKKKFFVKRAGRHFSFLKMAGRHQKGAGRHALQKRPRQNTVNMQFTINDISLKLKKQLVKSLVWSIALYGSESWAVKKCDEKRITAFELWCWRRVLRISWTEYKTNVWVRQKIGVPEQNGLLEQLKKRKLAKYGHWKRRSEGLVMAVTEGEIEGKCLPGRRRTAWIDNVGRWTEGGLPAARRIALDRL